jgi:hypothetical protein
MSVIKKGASRREFVQGIATGAMGLAAAGHLSGANLVAAQSQQVAPQACTEKVTVLNPLGTPPDIRLKPQAQRPDTLDGKTIFFVNDGFPGSDSVLHEMMDWFRANYPKTNLEYRYKGMGDAGAPPLWEEMSQKADAMILGVGH